MRYTLRRERFAVHWIDTVPAVPTLGVLVEPWVMSAADMLRALKPLVERLRKDDGSVQVASENLTTLVIRTAQGYKITVDAENVIVAFTYDGEIKNQAGDLPHLRYPVKHKPYSSLRADVVRLGLEVLAALQESSPRKVRRVGLIVAAHLDGANLPPGLIDLWSQFTAPWGEGSLVAGAVKLTTNLARTDAWVDRCHHTLDRAVERPEDDRCTLDWQRYFEPAQDWKTPNVARQSVEACVERAMSYFQRLGEGDLDDGHDDHQQPN